MMRGAFIGHGYVQGKGPVEVFADLDKTTRLHCLTRRDEWIYINRNRVVFTKQPTHPEKVKNNANEEN